MTNNYNIKYIIYIIIIQSCSLVNITRAQDKTDIQLASEYLSKGEKEKAKLIYEQLNKKPENTPFIYNNYFNLLLDLGQFAEAENYVERLLKRENKLNYKIDLGVVFFKSGNLPKSDKHFKAIIKDLGEDIYQLKSAADYLASRNLIDYAITTLLETRKQNENNSLFALELANYYRLANKRDQMVEEYLNYVVQTPSNSSYIKNVMQILLTKPEELESLERLLLDRIQTNQNSEVYADLIIWVNLQQKNFYGAFIQARAYDKRFKKEESKTLEIAHVALSNQDYENADKAFSYVIKEYAGTPSELQARLGLIKAREAKVKNKFPVNRDSVRYLISEYKNFKKRYPDNQNIYEATINQSLLYAYFLDEKDSAIFYLQDIIANTKVTPNTKAKAKVDLGDIYLLKDEPWEATLLYSQVEKTMRESPQGYEAKLKNAKLHYYKGEFKLAQEHLDILKQATTREIANDAMNLSMLIKENITFDTVGADLKEYSNIELLVAQNKFEEALSKLSLLSEKATTTTIKDDAYWLEASLRLKKGEYEKALSLCEKILTEFPEDILADDAYFIKGEIYERNLKQKDKAMEIYREFLNKYPGSVYVAEARKRFRTMRGDFDNLPVN